MKSLILASVCCLHFSALPLFGQGVILVGSGYAKPTIPHVAPGQLTTLFVTGLKTVLPDGLVKASGTPLPAALAGISVMFRQSTSQTFTAPLLQIQQRSGCGEANADSSTVIPSTCLITAITFQTPYEMPFATADGAAIETSVVIRENGTTGVNFQVVVQQDNLHILSTCDQYPPTNISDKTCIPVVTHSDGTLVTSVSPAVAGETVVIYGFGLSALGTPVKTGEATPFSIPVTTFGSYSVLLDLAMNASPTDPARPELPSYKDQSPLVPFAGLVPGYVGLWQINVHIPKDLVPSHACGGNYRSNLTIDIGFMSSFDGAPICIQ